MGKILKAVNTTCQRTPPNIYCFREEIKHKRIPFFGYIFTNETLKKSHRSMSISTAIQVSLITHFDD